ncbi:unnamed protein product [Phaedon cochleariae]|uniref:Uncharacterized protein n=1 Tax=Phaedon cochleariae TaxID=80249 RepID=A0A9P0DIQ3_PHACE|nr:unnamed protein product [Phaedon cochleariae]
MGASIYFIALLIVAANAYEFPASFKRCQLNDMETCLATTIQDDLKLIGSSGISSLNIPSIEPLKIPAIEIGAGSTAVNLVQKYSDVNVHGFSQCKVETANLNIDKKTLTFTAIYPEIRQEAKYSLNGKILVIPVHGSGDSVIRLKEATFVHTITFKEMMKKGKKLFHVEDYKLSITIKGAHYDFRNLFDGDKNLADNILKVINENWNVIFDDVKHGVESSYAAVFKALANKVFDNIPMDDIFLK